MKEILKKISLFKWTVIFVRILKRKHGIITITREFFGFSRDWHTYRNLSQNSSFIVATSDLYPRLFDKTVTTGVDPVYFYQDVWCAKKIFEARPTHHVDVGSHLPTIGIISQFVPTTMVDIRPPSVTLPELSFVKGSILALPFKDASVESLSSICVIEHIGLGRYGDTLDPFGSEKSAEELSRVLAHGGSLYISVPIDTESKVYFNAHRAFTRDHILKLFAPLKNIEETYIYQNTTYPSYDPIRGFGTGLYHLKKI